MLNSKLRYNRCNHIESCDPEAGIPCLLHYLVIRCDTQLDARQFGNPSSLCSANIHCKFHLVRQPVIIGFRCSCLSITSTFELTLLRILQIFYHAERVSIDKTTLPGRLVFFPHLEVYRHIRHLFSAIENTLITLSSTSIGSKGISGRFSNFMCPK